MAELRGQLRLFEVTEPRPPKATTPAPQGDPKWTQYRPSNPVRCDDCLTVLIGMNGHGPRTRHARWKRTTPNAVMYLCSAHAEDRRVEDQQKGTT